MVRYHELGFKTFEEYFQTFLNTLLPTNKTYEYFVDWQKVKENVKNFKYQIFLLNSLRVVNNKKELKTEFKKLILKYPNVVQVLPLLIAERLKNGKLKILDPEIMDFIEYDFNKENITQEEAEKYVYFAEKTGITDLISKVKDIYDYLLGVEVGLDTNARKNRSGTIFEKLVFFSLEKCLPQNRIRLVNQDPNFSLYKRIGKTTKEQAKRHDFILYFNDTPKVIIEVNFYNSTGSKPISIAESYIKLSKEAQKHNVYFVWITDGPAWINMKEPLLRAMQEIDFVLNYRMIPKFCTLINSLISDFKN